MRPPVISNYFFCGCHGELECPALCNVQGGADGSMISRRLSGVWKLLPAAFGGSNTNITETKGSRAVVTHERRAAPRGRS